MKSLFKSSASNLELHRWRVPKLLWELVRFLQQVLLELFSKAKNILSPPSGIVLGFINCRLTNKSLNSFFCIFVVGGFCLLSNSASAQLTGVKNIPGDYATLALAISDLNTNGVGAGGVTLNLLASNPQTAPAGGYVIGGSGSAVLTTSSASNQIVFKGNLNTISAPTPQSSGAINDALFKIIGADWITIDSFTLIENPSNATTTAGSNNMTEFGIALFYVTTTNGCQNNTLKNCTVDLNRNYQNTFGIYSNSTHSATSMTTSATATGVSGGNHNLKINSNNILDVNIGIIVIGPTASTDHNDQLEIGTSNTTGNSITNYGTTNAISGYANVSGTVNGILVRNTKNFTINNNTIISSVGIVTAGTMRGIFVPSFSNTPTGSFSNSISSNSISVKHGSAAATISGIQLDAETATSTSTLSISNNDFNNTTHTVASSGSILFISNSGPAFLQNIIGNTFTNLTVNTTGSVNFILNPNALPVGGTKNINNNSVVTGFTKTGAGGNIILHSDNASSPNGSFVNVSGNDFSNISFVGSTNFSGWSNSEGTASSGPVKTITNNTISNITGSSSPTGQIRGMSLYFGGPGSVISNNVISNLSGGGIMIGLDLGDSQPVLTCSNNSISNLFSSGSQGVSGISSGNPDIIIEANDISDLSCSNAAGSVNGILITTPTVIAEISKNKIYDLELSGAANAVNGIVNGINIQGGTNVTTVNNMIGDLRAPAASLGDAVRGIGITSTTTNSVQKVYYNSVYLAGTSTGANFGNSCIWHTASATSTTSNLDLRNNILVNNSTPKGTANIAVYRRSSTSLNNFASTSNNNLFYSGTPGAQRLIFWDGSNELQTLANYQAHVTTREINSVTENPQFLSTVGASVNFLHLDPDPFSLASNGAQNISGIVDDFDGDTRHGNVGYAGNGTAPDIGADEYEAVCVSLAVDSHPVEDSVCVDGIAMFTGGISGTPTPIFIWQVQAGGIGPWVDLTNTSPYSGVSTTTLTISPADLSLNENLYRLKGTNVCGTVETSPAILRVYESPVANAGADGIECDLSYQLNAIGSIGTGLWTSNSPGVTFTDDTDPNTIVNVSGPGLYTFTWTESTFYCTDADMITIEFSANTVNTDYFRSKNSGLWNDIGIWESSTDGLTWCDASLAPDYNANAITILPTHDVFVNADVTADQLTIAEAAALNIENGSTLTILNGTGTDLQNDGTIYINHADAVLATSGVIQNDGQITTDTGTIRLNEGGSISGTPIINFDEVTLHYAGTTPQTTTSVEFNSDNSFDVENVIIGNPSGVTLHASRTIDGELIMQSGQMILESNDLTIGSLFGSNGNYVRANGTGRLRMFAPAAEYTNFWIGVGEGEGNQITISPTAGCIFEVGVRAANNTNEFTAPVNDYNLVAPREWDIQPVCDPGATFLSLYYYFGNSQPTAVIGHYTNGAWEEYPAGYDIGNFTTVVNSFSPFGVGLATGFAPACTLPEVEDNPVDQTVCEGTSASFTATFNGGDPTPTYQWQEQVDGMGAWNDITEGSRYTGVTTITLTIAPTSTSLDGNRYRLVASNDCGEVESTSALLTVNPPPVSNAGLDAEYCGNDLFHQLDATPSPGATGLWSPPQSEFIFYNGGITNPDAQVSVSFHGDYTFTWTETIGGCVDADDVVISFYQQPEIFLPLGGEACGLTTYLNGSVFGPATTTWTVESAPMGANVIFTPNANDPAAEVTVDLYGDYVFKLMAINGSCMEMETLPLTFTEPPVIETCPPNITTCLGYASNPILLTGGDPAGGDFFNIYVTGNAEDGFYFDPFLAEGPGIYSVQYIYYDFPCYDDCTFTITVFDNPVVTCPTDFSLCVGDPDVDLTTLTYSPVGGMFSGPFVSGNLFQTTSAGQGEHTITYTYTDGNGCPGVCTFTITLTSPPVCSINGPLTVCPGTEGVQYVAPSGMAIYDWSISGNGSIGLGNAQTVEVEAGPDCDESFTLTLIITDANGCTSTCSQLVNVNDIVVPAFTNCPSGDIDLGCNPALPTQADAIEDAGIITDNCNVASVSAEGGTITGTCTKTQSFIVTALDDCGNDTVCIVTYTWKSDLIDPEFTSCPAMPIDLGCNPATLPTQADAVEDAGSVIDNCNVVSVIAIAGSISGTCTKTQSFIVTALDDCGNDAVCIVTYTWKSDLVDPEFTDCPATPIDLVCNPSLPTQADAIEDAGEVTDNCNVASFLAVAGSITGTCTKTQSFIVTALDECGNDAVCTVTYTWKSDIVDPEFTSCPTLPIDLGCNLTTLPTQADAVEDAGSVIDNCNVASVMAVAGSITGTCTKTQSFIVTALDDCGNDAVCTVTYTWKSDLVDPEFTNCPTTPIDLGCNPALPTQADAIEDAGEVTDNCNVASILAVGGSITGTCTKTQSFIVTALDECGNDAVCIVTYTWKSDLIDPEFTSCPATPIDLGCNPILPTQADAIEDAGEVTDNCNVASVVAVAGSITGTCTRTQSFIVTALDECGNEAVCTVTYTWKSDLVDPEFTSCQMQPIDLGCNPNLPTQADAIEDAGEVTDNCNVTSVSAVTGTITGTCTKTQSFIVTAFDNCGNDAVCTVTYIWKSDLVDPEFTSCPALPIDVGCNPTTLPTQADAVEDAGSVIDNCNVASVIAVAGSITGTCTKTQSFTITALDDCGNDAVCIVTYTWKSDLIDPEFTSCPATPIDLGCNPTLPTQADAIEDAGEVTDNCNVASVLAVAGSITGTCTKTQSFIVTALDDCGNDAICIVTYIWKSDLVDPAFTACPSTTINLGCDPALPTIGDAIEDAGEVTDNCNVASVTAVGGTITGGCTKAQSFIVTALDDCGNDAICSVTYTWSNDNEIPEFTSCPTAPIDLGCNPNVPLTPIQWTKVDPLKLLDYGSEGGLQRTGMAGWEFGAESGEINGDFELTYVVEKLDPVAIQFWYDAIFGYLKNDPDSASIIPLMPGDGELVYYVLEGVSDYGNYYGDYWIDYFQEDTEVGEITSFTFKRIDDVISYIYQSPSAGTVTGIVEIGYTGPVYPVTTFLNAGHRLNSATVNYNPSPGTVVTEVQAISDAGEITDNCNVASVNAVGGSVVGECDKTQTWTITAIDDCGNDASCEVTYTWSSDVIGPEFLSCPASPIDLGCNPTNPITETQALSDAGVVEDECNLVSVSATAGPVTGTCIKTQIWTVSAIDECDNQSECEVTYTWTSDTDDPGFSECPLTPIDLGCNPLPVSEAQAIDDAGDVTEGCSLNSITAVGGAITGTCTKTQTWTVTAEDECGNESECQVIYTWTSDTEDPVFSNCPVTPIDLGSNPLPVTESQAISDAGTVTDNCNVESITAVGGAITGVCEKTQSWTVTATDECGNSSQCIVTYNWIVDTEDPVFTDCPTSSIDLGCNPPAITEAQAIEDAGDVAENCNSVSISASGGAITGTCTKTQTWTVTAMDEGGNEAICQVMYTWSSDTEDPVFTDCPTSPINLGCNPTLPTQADAIEDAGEVTDNCNIASVLAVAGSITGTCTKTQSFTVTALDDCGNDAVCIVTYSWQSDLVDPAFTACPSTTINLGCDPALPTIGDAIADAGEVTDNCNVASVTAVGGTITGGCTKAQSFIVTALDDCGNDAVCTVTYTWSSDTEDPVFVSCPTSIIELACNPGIISGPIEWTKSFPAYLPDYGDLGGLERVGPANWNVGAEAAPVSGNFTLEFVIESIVQGHVIGDIMVGYAKVDPDPSDILILGHNNTGALMYPGEGWALHAYYPGLHFWVDDPETTANAGDIYTFTINRVGGLITYTITGTSGGDISGIIETSNTGVIYPVATLFNYGSRLNSAILTLNGDPNQISEAQAIEGAGEISDNCNVASVNAVGGAVTGDCDKTQTWTITAIDDCGNDASCEVTYSWTSDVIGPEFLSCPASPIDLGCNPTNPVTEAQALGDAGVVEDECNLVSVSATAGPVTGTCTKTQIWTVSAIDECDNESECEVTYTWKSDTDDPVLSECPLAPIDLGCNPLPVSEAQAIDDAGDVTESCNLNSITAVGGAITGTCTKTQTWTVTAEDECGNESECQVTYTWKSDTEDPVFSNCPVTPIDLGSNPLPVTESQAISDAGAVTDNCNVESITAVGGAITGVCEKTKSWTVTATDECGNTSQCIVTYNWIVDTEDPAFTDCPTSSIDLGCNPPAITEAQAIEDAGDVAENCNSVSLSASGGAITGTCTKTQTWTVTAMDEGGNEATCQVMYTWSSDIIDPIFGNCPATPIDLGCNPTLPTQADAIEDAGAVTDNCSVASVVAVAGSITGICTKTQSFTITATDDCANEATCIVTYTWTDDEVAPEFTNCPTAPIDLGCNEDTITEAQAITDAGITTEGCGGVDVTAIGGSITGTCTKQQIWTVTAVDDCDNESFCEVTYTWSTDNEDPVFAECPTSSIDLGCNPGIISNPIQWTKAFPEYLLDYGSEGGVERVGPPNWNVGAESLPVTGDFVLEFVVEIIETGAFIGDCMFGYAKINPDPSAILDLQCNSRLLYFSGGYSFGPHNYPCLWEDFNGSSNAVAGDVVTFTITRVGGLITFTLTDATGGDLAGTIESDYTGIIYPVMTFFNYGCRLNSASLITSNDPDQISEAQAIEGAGEITDNCNVASVTAIGGPVVGECDKTQTWTITAIDDCGNDASCEVTYSWTSDVISPEFLSCPTSPIDLGCNPINAITEAQALSDAGAVEDECNLVSVSSTAGPITGTCIKTQIWIVSALDECDNQSECEVTYTWTDDTVVPAITCPPTFSLEIVNGFNLDPVPANEPQDPSVDPDITGYPTITENCGDAQLAFQDSLGNLVTGNCPLVYQVFRRWTIADDCNPGVSCVQVISLNSQTPDCPIDFEVCIDDAELALTGASPTGGNYTGTGVSMNIFNPDNAGVGIHTVTYTYTDINGCNLDCQFNITVNPLPQVTCPEPVITCITDDAFELTVAQPLGGNYSGPGITGNIFDPAIANEGVHLITYTYTDLNGCEASCTFNLSVYPEEQCNIVSEMNWVLLPASSNGDCVSNTDCCEDIFCYGLEYTPAHTGYMTSYTTGFFTDCVLDNSPVLSNASCVMIDNSDEISECLNFDLTQILCSGNSGLVPVTAGIPQIIHQVCYLIPDGLTVTVVEDDVTDLATTINLEGGGFITEFPAYEDYTISRPSPDLPVLIDEEVNCNSLNEVLVNECLAEAEMFDPQSLESQIANLYSVDCGTVTAEYLSTDAGELNSNCSWSFTYHYIVTGCSGFSVPCSVTRSGSDQTQPELMDEDDSSIFDEEDVNECLTTALLFDPNTLESGIAALYQDNCSSVTATYTSTSGINNNDCSWSFTYTFVISDGCSVNNITCEVTRSGSDQISPSLTGIPFAGTTGTNACFTNAVTAAPFNPNNAITGYTDNCGGELTTTLTNTQVTGDNCNWAVTYTFTVFDPCMNPLGNQTYSNYGSDQSIPVVTEGTIADCYESVALAEAAALAATTASDNCAGSLTYSVNTAEGICDSVITVTVTDGCGNSNAVEYETRINCQTVRLKVFLEGPYDAAGDSMLTTLNKDHLLPGQNTTLMFMGDTPSGQPYNTQPYNYNGNTGVMFGDPPYGTIPYPSDVVDWILVSVREEGILPAQNIWTCAGWVHKDGKVTFPENCSFPVIDIQHDYYIVVQHRNHLGIMSPSFVDIECDGAFLQWDFTTSDSYKPAFRIGQKLIDGIWTMLSSNSEQVVTSRAISSPDLVKWKTQQGTNGYKIGDHNMNRAVNSADETIWKSNQNKTTGVIFY